MGTLTFASILAIGLCIGYVILLGTTQRRRTQLDNSWLWMMAVLITALVAQAANALDPSANILGLTQPALNVVLTSAVLVALSALTFNFLYRRFARLVAGAGAVWLVLILLLLWQMPDSQTGQVGWFGRVFNGQDGVGLVVFLGWLLLSGLSLAITFNNYYRAHLPEAANRALFWGLVFPLVVMGMVMSVSSGAFLRESGWALQFVGLGGLLYSAAEHRVLDMRRLLRLAIASGVITFVTALFILVALFAGNAINADSGALPLALAIIATIAAIIYTPFQAMTLGVVRRMSGTTPEDTTSAVRIYSQRVSSIVELGDLAGTVTDAMREAMRVRGGGVLLATIENADTVRLEPMIVDTTPRPPLMVRIPSSSPIYGRMFINHLPVLQYDLEYAREYSSLAPEIAAFFRQLHMSAYAPIVVQGQLIGVLSAGAKINDDPFYPQDVDMLATLANQTGVALRNARLVTDLKRTSIESHALNSDLLRTKERLEQLDSVKTDFVTIASHELRTPLAQIRGYTDILDAMNEQAMLDQDQVGGMVSNMRKATDRLEKLIADMLDVSQLGLDAMDLRFAQTTLDSVLRLAIEPLAESIKQRKLQLTARGLKGLPPIEADMQRLVQAFRNICVNAVKYTPDGGRIDIVAHVERNEQTEEEEIVVTIADTGIGIDPRNHELIFEKFFRVADPGLHSTGTTKFMGAGPGLGLTIARGVIEGHGGHITVESPGYEPQKLPGSVFIIHLPIHPPQGAKRVMPFESSTGSVVLPVPAGAMKGN
ncbi:MAG: GAF domain-containing sensor histidine kinase [Anaerolineae bacterium]|nr:GAF domain-containing sensor histidine kinase [Anaerolineae bacterium]